MRKRGIMEEVLYKNEQIDKFSRYLKLKLEQHFIIFFQNIRKNYLEKVEKKIIEVFYYGNYILLKKFYFYKEIDILTLIEIFFFKKIIL